MDFVKSAKIDQKTKIVLIYFFETFNGKTL
mgnify:CR=1 FL=1|jgi:hypothetical protein